MRKHFSTEHPEICSSDLADAPSGKNVVQRQLSSSQRTLVSMAQKGSALQKIDGTNKTVLDRLWSRFVATSHSSLNIVNNAELETFLDTLCGMLNNKAIKVRSMS